MLIGDKKALFLIFLLIFTLALAIDIGSFIKNYYLQSVVENRVIVTFSPNPQVYTDVVKRVGDNLLVQTNGFNREELLLFKDNKSFLLLPSKKMYVPLNVVDPELLTLNLLKNKKDNIKKVFENCVDIEGKGRHIRVFFDGNRFFKIEMYVNNIPYKTITYTYYKSVKLKKDTFDIPSNYTLPENDENIFDKLNTFYDNWSIKSFKPFIIEGFKGSEQSIIMISKFKIEDSIIGNLRRRLPRGLKPILKKWENFYILSIGLSPF